MRYDKKIYFVKQGKPEYDYDTGNSVPGKDEKESKWANVSDVGSDAMQLLYGGLKQGALVARIRGQHEKEFDFIQIGSTKYNVDRVKTFRRDQVFNLSEQK